MSRRPRTKSIHITSLSHSKSYRNELLSSCDPQTVPLPTLENTIQTQEDRILTTSMLFSGKDELPNIKLLKEHLKRQGKLENYAIMKLLHIVAEIFKKEKNIVEVDAPAIVVGDIHGQFYDMLNFLDLLGNIEDNKFVFLGDYVDRGDFSTEIVIYLFALKICYPKNITLLRGNHETRLMCEYMTFLLECHNKYSIKIYEEFVNCFDCLPLVALIHKNFNGDIICMHGGLSPSIGHLTDIEKINRFMEPPNNGPLCDLLWADPVTEWDPDSPEWVGISRSEWDDITFIANKQRKTSYYYGAKAVTRFLKANNLFCIVRAHQVQDNGFKDHKYFSPERHLAMVFTIFSAPNYCDYYRNYGAVMRISERPFDIKTFVWKQHPVVLEDFLDGISYSFDYLMEGIVNVLQEIIVGIKDNKNKDEDDEESLELKKKSKLLYAKTEKLNLRREKFLEINNVDYHENMSIFEKACLIDQVNEERPTTEMVTRKFINHPGSLRKGVSSPALLQQQNSEQNENQPPSLLPKKEKGGLIVMKKP